MTDFEQFLMDFLHAENRRLPNPDGRLLYRYECTDGEFWELVNLLRESEPPTGHDFDRYRDKWKEPVSCRKFRLESPFSPIFEWFPVPCAM